MDNKVPSPETLAMLLKAQPMRRMISLVCGVCGYDWVAPAQGRCPKCHGPAAQVEGSERVSALRVV